jgi:hypothetical protein
MMYLSVDHINVKLNWLKENPMKQLSLCLILSFVYSVVNGQVTVFSDNFSTNNSTTWTTNGPIGSSAWSVLRSGDDWGARRNTSPQQLEFTNDVGTATNLSGWIFASTPTPSFASPYNTTLAQGGVVSWSFNMRQIRTDPSGFDSGNYGVAFILAGETATSSMDGNGYAVVLGQSGSTDPVRLVSYTAGIMGNGTITNIISSNTTGLTDFGAEYLSIKVTYNPCLNHQWELFVRNDGGSFMDPLSGTLISQGTATNSLYTGTALNMMAGYWQGSITANQTAFMDNVTVQVSLLEANAGSYGPVCTNDPDIVLMGTPSGGVWSGVGVTGNTFNPNAGTQTLTYTVTDVNGCSDSDQTTITVNPCITAPEMRWILLEEDVQNGSCISTSDCDDDVICYALQYTPNMTGTLTSYTTGFIVDCNNGANPIISNTSCVMTSAVNIDNQCATLGQVLINASGNTGAVSISQGVSKILHQVCFSIPSGSINIIEDEVTDLTASIDSVGGGGAETEYPSYVTSTLDSTLDCSILPLRFLSFTASRYDDRVSNLEWITVDEMNNSHFEIQRSTDGGFSFQPIGTVSAHTEPRAINYYQFFDQHAHSGQNYYRLKQIDLDDKFQYSQVKNVFFGDGAFIVNAFPNPVADILFLKINHAEETGRIMLFDVSGKEVFSKECAMTDEDIKVNVNGLQPGTYTLVVTSGANRYEDKIIVVGN